MNPNLTDTDQFRSMMDHKRSVVKIGLFIGIPLVFAMAIKNLIKGNHFMAFLNCMMLLILILLAFVIRGRIDEKFEYKTYSILFRLFNAAFGISVFYDIGFQSNFSRVEWCYIYPILAFFAVGVKEGIIWVSVFYGIVAFLILNFDLQGITSIQIQELRSRFLVSFFAVCMLSLFLEHAFRHVQQRLLHHQCILKGSEDRYRDLVEYSQYLICTHDLNGQILSVNQEGARLLGYDQRNLLNKNIRDLLVPRVRDEFDTYLDTIRKQGAAKGLMLLQTATGERRIWQYNNTLRTEGVTSPIVRAIAHDVTERIQAEKAVKRLSKENAVMAEIGRIISSTLNIEEVYERFAGEVRKLIPFDRIVIDIIDTGNNTVINAYIAGKGIADRKVGEIYPLEGSGIAEMLRTKSSLLIQTEDFNEYKDRFPVLLSTFQAGFRSFMDVPLFSKGQIIGGLLLRSLKPYAYTEPDLRLAERVGNQIAGAFANAQLFAERKRAEEALRAEKQRFQTLSESAPFGIVVIDKAGTFKYINPKFREIFGYDLNDAPDGKTWFRKAFPDPTYRHYAISVWINELGSSKPGEKISETFTVACKDGTEKIVNFIPVKLETGEYFMSCEDITDRKHAEEALLESEERFRELAENIREVFYVYEQGITRYVSPAYEEIWGRPSQSLYQDPKSIWDSVHPEDKDRVMRSLGMKSREEVDDVYRIVRPDGSIRWIKERSFPIYDDSGKVHRIVGIAADITDLKLGEEKLKYLSLHDPLTGLYNRIYFEEEMSRIEKSRYNSAGIVSCDVDGLKLVNDTLGHNQGDNLLIAAARVIKESFREGDLIARIGGDEFSVLLPNTTESGVKNACQRIQEAVESYNDTNPDFPLSISVGFAIKNGTHRNLKDLFKEADNNMYRKKLYRAQSVRSTIVNTLINTLKARDFTTERHVIRLEELLIGLAALIGLSESTKSDLILLIKFHDIGKVGISDSILFKKGPLTPEEWMEMKRHCEIGYRIALSAPELIHISDWILKHHEWWNGQGYPLGIKGEEIPIECRLLAIAEAYEAMTSLRPYRKAFPHAKAVAELLSHSGTQFDPNLLEKFLQMVETYSPEPKSNETSAV